MRLLFSMDAKDYDPKGNALVRPSARCITICEGRVAMVYSRKYDYYKFPGGGIERGETREQALIRETAEEAGLRILPDSIVPYGYVHRVQKSDCPGMDLFVQDNFYYLCSTESQPGKQKLDDYEAEEGFTLDWVEPETAIRVNRERDHGPKDQKMLEREARVLELLKAEGFFSRSNET